MKIILQVLKVTLVAILLIIGCTGKHEQARESANNFRIIEIDSTHEIKGRYPVTNEIAEKGYYYHFLYDDKGKPIKIEYRKGSELKGGSFFGFKVAQVLIEYYEEFEKWSFLDVEGNPVQNNNQVYYIRLYRDRNNHILHIYKFGKDEGLIQDKNGIAAYSSELDKEGRRINEVYFDSSEERMIDKYGVYEIKWKYDNQGNTVEQRYFGIEGQLTEHNDLGVAIIKWQYDDNGNRIEERYFGTNEKLKERKDIGTAIIQNKYDINGNVTLKKYFGTDEQLTEHKDWGFTITRWKYDKNGNRVEVRYLDSNEQLKEFGDLSFAIIRFEYDDGGTLIKTLYLNKKGEVIEEGV